MVDSATGRRVHAEIISVWPCLIAERDAVSKYYQINEIFLDVFVESEERCWDCGHTDVDDGEIPVDAIVEVDVGNDSRES